MTMPTAHEHEALMRLIEAYADARHEHGAPEYNAHTMAARNALYTALLHALTQMGGWQPIETAPKDGTEILLTNGNAVTFGHWLYAPPSIREKRDADGRYIDQDESDGYIGWMDWHGGIPNPTHWMPLPPSPAAEAAAEREQEKGQA